MQVRTIRRALVLVSVFPALLALGCASSGPGPEAPRERTDAQFDRLVEWMTGSFSSADQAKQDDQYFDIRLKMVEIWPERRDDAVWIYVEQATATALNRPYRQRVYRVSRIDENRFESAVFELPTDPLAFAGWWETPDRFEQLQPENLTELTGCAVTLRYDADRDAFTGGTEEGSCPSSLRGASYVMSETTIDAQMLRTWDRGFDSDGRQVWGAAEGGYEFVRVD